MEDEINRSSEALHETENQNSETVKEVEEEGNRDEKTEIIDEQRRMSSDSTSNSAVGNSSIGESKASELETLSSVQLSDGDFEADFDKSSHLLSEVPVEYSLQPIQSAEDVKDQVTEVQEESLKCITGQSALVQVENQIVPYVPSKLEVLPMSVTQSISSTPSSTPPEQKLQPAENENYVWVPEEKRQTPVPKAMQKAPSDGYNWRKYGQKQVKSPEGSRSYYRCTFSDCSAKKIECSDRSNHLIETVYRSHHNHDPPQKVNCTKENKPTLSIVPFNGNDDKILPVKHFNDPVPSTPSKERSTGIDEIPDIKQQESSDSDQTMETNTKELLPKIVDTSSSLQITRQKRNFTGELESPKPAKKPKYVVHAAGDVGISGDGHRWRKYGQKMVKGNPHPRNYYRCTSAGCPVRKYIETAVDNTNAVVITYKGMHDHDTPVPRKRDGPRTTTPISSDDLHNNKTNPHKSQTQWSVGKEGELMGEALSVGGEKPSESAKTLLSVGFEIKPC